MSRIIPSAVAGVRRRNADKAVRYAGLDCVLHKVATRTGDKLDDDPTIEYADPIDTQVQVVWTPNIRMLKSLGLYTEEKAPLHILRDGKESGPQGTSFPTVPVVVGAVVAAIAAAVVILIKKGIIRIGKQS